MAKNAEAQQLAPDAVEQKGPDSKDKKGVNFKFGQEVTVRRTSGHLDSGWKIGMGYEGATVQVTKEHPTKPGELIEKWLPREDIAAANEPGAPEYIALEVEDRKMVEAAADGSRLELVQAYEGEDYSVVANAEAGMAIRPEGHAEIREKTAADLADMRGTFDSLLEATLKSQKISRDKALAIRKAAEAQKTVYLLEASAGEDLQAVINEKIGLLLNMSSAELAKASACPTLLELQSAATKAEIDLTEAQTAEAVAKADRGLALSAYEVALRRIELGEIAGEKTDKAAEMAQAEGFIKPAYSPLYEQGSDATRARIAEIIAELRDLDSKESQLTAGGEIRRNQIFAEMKRHEAVLPLLVKMEGLADALTSIDERTDKAVQEHNKAVKAAVLKIARQRGAYGANITKKSAIMRARDGFMELWKGMPWTDDAQKDRDAAEAKLQQFETKRDQLIQEAEDLESMGVVLDFDPEAEKSAATTELHDSLIDLARDGEIDGVKEFIGFMLKKEGLSDIERSVLEETLRDIEEPTHDLFKAGDNVAIEIGLITPDKKIISGSNLEGRVVGFTLDGKVRVDVSGEVRTYDDEMVVKLDRKVPASSYDVAGVPQGAKVAIEHDDGSKNYGEVLGYDAKTGMAEVRLENGDVIKYDREMVVELNKPEAEEEVAEGVLVEEAGVVVKDETLDLPAGLDWDWNDFGTPEVVTVGSNVETAAAKELGVNTAELDGLKATYELIRDQLRLSALHGGSEISMEALGLPKSWNDFLSLEKKADRGFLRKIFGGETKMQKAIKSLAEASTSIIGGAKFKAPSAAQRRIGEMRARAEKTPNHVFRANGHL